ncbi:hypothetical protein EZV62_024963 [Acer yangbiense]|uniref:Uncharacterized protein n=1 Tax=Acer yangbiense TaxID=1000413 RepID=A0A5C7GWI4_9ROSI|nr:hypothetical protein EZV62_024963 [Acer yangbiense]
MVAETSWVEWRRTVFATAAHEVVYMLQCSENVQELKPVTFSSLSLLQNSAQSHVFFFFEFAAKPLGVTWKKIAKSMGMWDSVREFARMYDGRMMMIIFTPLAFLSRFPFISNLDLPVSSPL